MPTKVSVDAIQSAIMRQFIRSISFRTAVTPPIVINDPFAPDPPQPPETTRLQTAVLNYLQPELTLYSSTGGTTYQYAPYGNPSDSTDAWQSGAIFIASGAVLLAGLGLYGLVRAFGD